MSKYAFVDGSYLIKSVDEMFTGVYDGPFNIHPPYLIQELGANKLYFYDALEDMPTGNNVDQDKIERIQRRAAFHQELRSTPMVHVREGSVLKEKGKAKRQKEVDVLLAVEAQSFAYRGVIEDAALVLGDSDFIPLVDALVQIGTNVAVTAKPECLDSLKNAADAFYPLDYDFAFEMMTSEWTRTHPKVTSHPGMFTSSSSYAGVNKAGHIDGRQVTLYQNTADSGGYLVAMQNRLGFWTCSDRETLSRYMIKFEGMVE